MRKTSLTALSRHELEHARTSSSGRSSKTVHGGHDKVLRQTVIALREGEELNEHFSPGEATIYVLQGRVLMDSGDTSWPGWVGDLLIVPSETLSLKALEDSAVLYTVVKPVWRTSFIATGDVEQDDVEQDNDAQHNDAQHNDAQHNDARLDAGAQLFSR